jgi:stress response protein YsnF
MAKTIAALFDNHAEAHKAVQDLVDHGFSRDDISVMAHDEAGSDGYTTTDEGPSGLAQGAGIGAALGGIGGLVIGLTALAIPGVGPVIAAGPLAAALLGAGVGAATGGLIGALTDMGIPEEHAQYYGEGVRRGGVLVTVAAADAKADQAASILSRHHPIDLSRRAEEWRQSGWSRFDPQAEPYRTSIATSTTTAAPRAMRAGAGAMASGASASTTTSAQRRQADRETTTTSAQRLQADRETTIPVVEEEMQVGKRAVERDVRVHTTVHETPVQEQVRLREEHVTVERRPVNRPVNAADQTAFKDSVIEVTETVEEPVVSKRARVVEEVVVHKDAREHVETVRDTVRRTDVNIEQGKAQQSTGLRSFETYDAGFRKHFSTTFASQPGTTYESYMPAYRYGYTLATDKRYSDRDWSLFESDARRDWERDHPGTWERFKASIRHAWDEVRGRR